MPFSQRLQLLSPCALPFDAVDGVEGGGFADFVGDPGLEFGLPILNHYRGTKDEDLGRPLHPQHSGQVIEACAVGGGQEGGLPVCTLLT